ncbi:hypothetical protein NIES4071_107400 (plasmid) [Calothrix sp. NIES-4071]|nr:hypothetical protein NIES4071_107400 [Calothrix sp. NIES-4071]BAZ64780.1 hypothetical protein NIES4105_105130 [Calothrix sp. NIES-4105]
MYESSVVCDSSSDETSVLGTYSQTTEQLTSNELTPEEECERLLLERKIERAFYEAGKALRKLRDKRLYRSTHKTFEEYCVQRFGYNRRQPYLLIEASQVVDNLSTECDPMDHILPTNERQVRALSKLEPRTQRQCWEQAVEEAGGKVPSGRLVKDIVERIMERTKIENPYSVGEVCQIIPKDNPDLRGKAGCWCLVKEIHEFSCTVAAWDSEYTLRIDHLKSLNYLDSGCDFMASLHKRISSIRSHGDLEEAAINSLRQLGGIGRHYLTKLEETFLTDMEHMYNTIDK